MCKQVCQILAGLAHYHAHGMVHLVRLVVGFFNRFHVPSSFIHIMTTTNPQDLKPANILKRFDGSLCLADFGVASFSSKRNEHFGTTDCGGGSDDRECHSLVIHMRVCVGTAQYNPPEIHGDVSKLPAEYSFSNADTWAVGCMALQLLGATLPANPTPSWDPHPTIESLCIESQVLKSKISQVRHVLFLPAIASPSD